MGKAVDEAVVKAVAEANEGHCKVSAGLVPGFATLSVDTAFSVSKWGIEFRGPVTFQFSVDEYNEKHESATLYLMQFDQEGLEAAFEKTRGSGEDVEGVRSVDTPGEDGGAAITGEPIEIGVQLVKVDVPGRDWPLLFGEVPVWLAINEAEQSGDADMALSIFEQGYTTANTDAPNVPVQDVASIRENVQANSKVSNFIHLIEADKLKRFDMAGKNEGRVETSLILSYDKENVSIDKPMTPYDRTVHNAVATLWRAGVRNFRVNQVYEAMTGSASNPRAETLKKVADSIEKQLHTSATIDFTDELRGRTLNDGGEEVTILNASKNTHVLSGDSCEILCSDGKTRKGYVLFKPPLLYEHDSTTGQIIRYPHRLLKAISEKVRATETNTLVRDHLIKRIWIMKSGKTPMAKQHKIAYSSIYEAAQKPDATRTEKSRIRKTAWDVLDAIKESGEIAGWSVYSKDGQTRQLGVEIELNDADKRRIKALGK